MWVRMYMYSDQMLNYQSEMKEGFNHKFTRKEFFGEFPDIKSIFSQRDFGSLGSSSRIGWHF